MRRPNHETDLKLYRKIFNVYFDVVNQIVKRTDLELETRKDEKDVFKYQKGVQKYIELFQKAGLEDKKITVTAGGFTCAFTLSTIRDVKKKIEKRLVTPRHHLYYIDVESEVKSQAA